MKPVEPVYMSIENSGEIRRDLLTSSKDLLNVLRRSEAFVDLRGAKLDLILEVKRVMEDIVVLERRLRSKLPKLPFEPEKSEGAEERRPMIKSANKLELLEAELARIEERLKSVS